MPLSLFTFYVPQSMFYKSSLAIRSSFSYSSSPCAMHKAWNAEPSFLMRSTGLPYSSTLPLSNTRTRSLFA